MNLFLLFATAGFAVMIKQNEFNAYISLLTSLGCGNVERCKTDSNVLYSQTGPIDCPTYNYEFQCDGSGSITRIFLRNYTLSGTISNDILSLTSLGILALFGNSLHG